MSKALNDVAFLLRSTHRLSVLGSLAEHPQSRSDLRSVTDVSRKTLGRTMDELAERRWIEQVDAGYEATPLGELVVADVSRAIETADVARRFRDVVEYLPIEAFTFDLRRLADARITRPSSNDRLAPIQRTAELFADARTIRVIGPSYDRYQVRQKYDLGDDGPQATVIFPDGALEAAREDEEVAALFTELIERGVCECLRYDGRVSSKLVIVDDEVVVLEPHDDRGFVPAAVESNDEAVCSWATETFGRYEAEAESIGPEAFSAE